MCAAKHMLPALAKAGGSRKR